MKAKVQIAILLGSLILLNLGHNIIPHHHHLDDTLSHDGCEQHDPGMHAGNADDSHRHCHAFNGFDYVLSFEKFPGKDAQKHITEDISAHLHSTFKPNAEIPAHTNPPGTPSFFPGCFGTAAGLRAPPFA